MFSKFAFIRFKFYYMYMDKQFKIIKYRVIYTKFVKISIYIYIYVYIYIYIQEIVYKTKPLKYTNNVIIKNDHYDHLTLFYLKTRSAGNVLQNMFIFKKIYISFCMNVRNMSNFVNVIRQSDLKTPQFVYILGDCQGLREH